MGGATRPESEIPLLLMLIYLFRGVGRRSSRSVSSGAKRGSFGDSATSSGRQSQVGSLAGAAHLLNDNAGVLR